MKLIASPPTAAEVETVRDLHAGGQNVRVIGQQLGFPGTIVTRCLRAPEMFDEYVDEVAVDRCLSGEQGIWERMTYRERNAVLHRAHERRQREHAENAGWSEFLRATSPVRGRARTPGDPALFPYAVREPAWLVRLAEITGFKTCARLLERAALQEKRREAQSA